MNRKLIIISNDGGKEEFLPGVKVDVQNYINYFTSSEGGAWDYHSEMKVPETGKFTPTMLKFYMKEEERKQHVDFWLIVFTGHGEATPQGESYFYFTNQHICYESQIIQATRNSRCLLIVDSCRSLPKYEEDSVIQRTVYFCESQDSNKLYRIICRNEYNELVSRVPVGSIQKGYATQFTKTAGEHEDGTGGYYSLSLLKTAYAEIDKAHETRRLSPKTFNGDNASFSWVHTQAKDKVVFLTDGNQIPVLYSSRTCQFPFYVVPDLSKYSIFK